MSDSNYYEEFINYVQAGDYKNAEEYLFSDLVDPSEEESYALRIACEKGYVDIVDLLIRDGRSDLTARGHSPLFSVCENNNLEIAKLLLKQRKEQFINIAYEDNEPIMICCEFGSLDVLKYLVSFRRYDESINPGARDSEALLIAIEYSHPEIVRYLLTRREINPTTRNNKPIILASDGTIMNDTECLKVLLNDQRIDPSRPNEDGFDALMTACRTENVDAVKVLLNDPRTDPTANDYRAFKIINHVEDDETAESITKKTEMIKLFINEERVNKMQLLRVLVDTITEEVEDDNATEDLFVHMGMIIRWLSENSTLDPLRRIYNILNDQDPLYAREILLNYDIDKIPLNRYDFHISPKKKEDKRFVDYLLAKFPYKKDKILRLVYNRTYQPEYEAEIKQEISSIIPRMENDPITTISEYLFGKRESELEKEIRKVMQPQLISKTISEYLE